MSLLKGKRGLVVGVANDRSIAWGIAKELAEQGAELAFTYMGDAFGKRVIPLAESLGAKIIMDADVQDSASFDRVFERLSSEWGSIDFLIHAVAYSDKDELTGSFSNTSKANFLNSMDISVFSFIDLSRRAAEIMPNGGSIITLSFLGSQRVTPFYNVMGVAKAALESSVRYMANDLGSRSIRVNAISPGPMKTLAGAAIGGARKTYRTTEENAPLRANAALEHVGGAACFLVSDWGASTTGDILFVDGGYHVLGMAQPENL